MFQQKKTKAKDFKNVMYSCKAIKKNKDEDLFLIGAYDKNITEVSAHNNHLDTVKIFSGHSKSVRSVNLSQDE